MCRSCFGALRAEFQRGGGEEHLWTDFEKRGGFHHQMGRHRPRALLVFAVRALGYTKLRSYILLRNVLMHAELPQLLSQGEWILHRRLCRLNMM